MFAGSSPTHGGASALGFVFHTVKNPARPSLPARARAPRRRWLGALALPALVAACSLTVDDYEPQRVTLESAPEPPPEGPACPDGEVCCTLDSECATGERCVASRCAPAEPCSGAGCELTPTELAPSCDDGVQNGDEADVDCGGSCAVACDDGRTCGGNADCASLACVAGECSAPSCDDGAQNGDESDVDCGGACAACPDGGSCVADADCESGRCGEGGVCSAPACDDGVQNGDELGVDCGGPCAAACPDGTACTTADECLSEVCGTTGCPAGVARCCAAPSCTDGISNGNETGVDCGGGCPRCPELQPCRVAADCASNNCFFGQCISCGDGALNGTESDIDCGGFDPFCRRCFPGEQCRADGDCQSGVCQDGRCCGGNAGDCTRCAERLSVNQSCSNAVIGNEPACTAFLSCLAANNAVCPTRFSPGCTGEGGVCNANFFGGDGGLAVIQANQVLLDAGCAL